jgi:hypothetical protein
VAAAPLTRIRELGAWLGRVGNVVMPSDVGKWGCRRLPSPTPEGHRVDAICFRVVSGCLPPSWVPSSGSGRGDRSRLTGHAGMAAVTEADRVLGIAQALDSAVGLVKARRRGVTAGGLLLSMACAQLAGADFLVGMDRHRADVASQLLEPVPTPASTTTAQLAKRFTPTHTAGIENGIGTVNARVLRLLPPIPTAGPARRTPATPHWRRSRRRPPPRYR